MYTIRKLLLAALIAVTAACSSESRHDDAPAAAVGDSIAVRITVSAPPQYVPQSRAAAAMTDDQESTVDDLLIMLFTPDATDKTKPATVYKVVEATNLQKNEASGGYSFDARIGVDPATTPAELIVVTVANAASRADAITAGMTYDEAQAALVAPAPDLADTRLTLWGIGDRPIDTSLHAQGLGITLIRDRARIVLGIDTEKVPAALFAPQSLQVMKASSGMLLMPSIANITGNKATAPSLPADNTTADSPVADNMKLYIAEADVLMGSTDGNPDDTNRLNRPAIIVGGSYREAEAPCYYRVDFKTKEGDEYKLIDVLRNHSYNITVTAVNGPGEPTPEEAYNSIITSIDAVITTWEDINNDIAFDGANWIAMPRTAILGPEAGAEAELPVATNVDPALWGEQVWAVETDAELFSVTIPESLDEAGAGMLTIKALQPLPDDVEIRTAQLHIYVTPRLRFIVNIVQQRSSGDGQHTDWIDGGNIPGTV